MHIEQTSFGTTDDGQNVDLFTITSSSGSLLQMTNFGAIVTQVVVPDRRGRLQNVTLGFSNLSGYLTKHPFFGATVGRFCNRIDRGRFVLDGKVHQLPINKEPNHIHGGPVGFDKRVWAVAGSGQPVAGNEETLEDSSAAVVFSLLSSDGDQGYPGMLKVTAEYRWSEANELTCTFRATTDSPTIVNMTNHAYWNLAGAGSGLIADHHLQFQSSRFLEVDDALIPTGAICDVGGTPLDFRKRCSIGSRLEQLPTTKGYDHCFVIDGPAGQLRLAARAEEPTSGRALEVWTTQPGVQLYTGNHLKEPFSAYSGFCLETQHYPDSPNKPHFPTTRLDPGEIFEETTVYRFGIS